MAEARCLRLEDQDRFVWRHWDGELIFFDDESGETRLLSGWAGAVLDLIAERQPIGIEALENELAAATDSADDTGHRERIREAVDMLRDNGLIGYTAK
jgi:hypothetical protein